MHFKLYISAETEKQLVALQKNKALLKRYKAVAKALDYLAKNPKHPGLNTHKIKLLTGPNDEEVFEAYAENNTPGAYRIFWCYGPGPKEITVLSITPHP